MGDAANTVSAYLWFDRAPSGRHRGVDRNMGMRPVTIALDGDTASYLVLALKEELGAGQVRSTTARVYNEVIDAIIAAMDPCEPNLRLVEQEDGGN